jgi:protein-tyrosine phosphatase
MAEAVLNAELERAGLAGRVLVDSAGTGDWHLGGRMDSRARAELRRRGFDGSAHRARQFQPAWFADRDLVLAMDLSNLANLRAMAPDAEAGSARLRLFRSFDPAADSAQADQDPYEGAVPDPYGGDPEDYALALDLVQSAARGFVARLAEFAELPARGAAG